MRPILSLIATLFVLQTLGVSGVAAQISPTIAINEVMYAPTAPEPEWVELYNTSQKAVDLTGWEVTDLSTSVILSDITIPPHSFLVLTKDSIALRTARNASYPIQQVKLPSLNNSGDVIVIRNDHGETMDSLFYTPSMGGSNGNSLERRSVELPTNLPTNWRSSRSFATPGTVNSVVRHIIDVSVDSAVYNFAHDTLRVTAFLTNQGLTNVENVRCQLFQDSDGLPLAQSSVSLLDVDSVATIHFIHLNELPTGQKLLITLECDGDSSRANDTLRIKTLSYTPTHLVAINEIMAAPVKPEPEWIELYNVSRDSIDLGGWSLEINKLVRVLPEFSAKLAPDSMIILTSDDTALSQARQIPIERCAKFPLPTLSNFGATIGLRSSTYELIDTVSYSATNAGMSIERIDPARSGLDSNNWAHTSDTTGATALLPNSDRILDRDLALRSALVSGDSIDLDIYNAGLQPVQTFEIELARTGFVSITDHLIDSLLPRADTLVRIGVPQDFYGSEVSSVSLQTEGDGRSSNDTLLLRLEHDIPRDNLVINEVMYDPATGSCEWVELYNASSRNVCLDGATLRTGSSVLRGSFAIHGLTIAPNDFGLLSANNSIYTDHPNFANWHSIEAFNTSSLELSNEHGLIVLTDSRSATLDSLSYSSTWHNHLFPDLTGISLERQHWQLPTNDSANWSSSFDSTGSTPLAANSSIVAQAQPSSGLHAEFTPNPFSTQDGFTITSTLRVETGNDKMYLCRVRLFDNRGHIVRTLIDGAPVTGAAETLFDGRGDDGSILSPGLYTTLIELSPTDQSAILKRTIGLVIAGARR